MDDPSRFVPILFMIGIPGVIAIQYWMKQPRTGSWKPPLLRFAAIAAFFTALFYALGVPGLFVLAGPVFAFLVFIPDLSDTLKVGRAMAALEDPAERERPRLPERSSLDRSFKAFQSAQRSGSVVFGFFLAVVALVLAPAYWIWGLCLALFNIPAQNVEKRLDDRGDDLLKRKAGRSSRQAKAEEEEQGPH